MSVTTPKYDFSIFLYFPQFKIFARLLSSILEHPELRVGRGGGIGLGVTSYPQSNHENVCAGQCQVNLDKVNGKYPPLLLQNSQFIFPTEKVTNLLLTLESPQKLSSGGGRKSSQL